MENLPKKTQEEYYIDLSIDEDTEDKTLVEETPIELCNIKSTKAERNLQKKLGSSTAYLSVPPQTTNSSGFRLKTISKERKVTPNFLRSPKQFSVTVKYHYPLIYFPAALENELKELQSFFKIPNRGSGSMVHRGKMVSTIGYRVNFDLETTRCFSRTVVEILDRYGVEILANEIVRIG